MIRFEKWEGLGNDFVLVDAAEAERIAALGVAAICDRRRGVGADGVLLITDGAGSEARMIVYNADGSRPEMCGNGLRCAVGWLAHRRGLAAGALEVLTDAGPRRCTFESDGAGGLLVTADMGKAQLVGELTAGTAGEHSFTLVDVGNPHAVSFAPFEDPDLDRLGPAIDRQRPGGSNVELCRVEAGRIEVAVWERGVGRTEACGTGACAAAVAACEAGRIAYDQPVEVALPGGVLSITVAREGRRVHMRGPARRVFVGELG